VSQDDLEAAERTLQARVRWTAVRGARGRTLQFEVGAEVERRQADFELGALVRPPPPDEPRSPSPTGPPPRRALAGAWAQVSGTDGALTATPASASPPRTWPSTRPEVAFEPRLWIDPSRSDGVRGARRRGLVPIQPVTTLVLPGLPCLHLPEGMVSVLQASAGVTFHPALGLDLGVDGYFDPMLRVVELPVLDRRRTAMLAGGRADSAARVSAQVTVGSAMGVEVLLRKSAGDHLTGCSYSFHRSVRTDPASRRSCPSRWSSRTCSTRCCSTGCRAGGR
jgi:hypothetical protein